jgi:hypothetical protein
MVRYIKYIIDIIKSLFYGKSDAASKLNAHSFNEINVRDEDKSDIRRVRSFNGFDLYVEKNDFPYRKEGEKIKIKARPNITIRTSRYYQDDEGGGCYHIGTPTPKIYEITRKEAEQMTKAEVDYCEEGWPDSEPPPTPYEKTPDCAIGPRREDGVTASAIFSSTVSPRRAT